MKLLATGNTAEVFEYEDNKVLKLYKSGYPFDAIQLEYNNSLIMNKSPINTPKVYELIEQDGRNGIIFQKITGSDLLSEYLQNPTDTELATGILQDLAKVQKSLSTYETKEGISYKDYLGYFGYEKSDTLPDGNAICHGDLHPGNIIRTPENELYLIDFMNVCHGPKEYDVARTIILITENNPSAEIIKNAYLEMIGMTLEQVEPYFDAIKWCRKREML